MTTALSKYVISYRDGVPRDDLREASAPGRVTLLGEHTDYNSGLALAVATPQRTTVVARLGNPGTVEVASAACGVASCEIEAATGPGFAVLAASLARAVGVRGVHLDVDSDLPVGAGLSSSAAYAVAVALALGVDGDPVAVAEACQRAEHAAGSDVGLLDQLVALVAREGEVVDLDFSDLTTSTFPLAESIGLSVVDTGVRRSVAASDYARRRSQCESAATVIGPLGLASLEDLGALHDELLRRRARHVVTECGRVRAGRLAARSGDLVALGSLLDEGHRSLRDDFEVSTPAVEAVRATVREIHGVVGVRLVGAGFGGCLVVAHDPDVAILVPGRWSARLKPGAGATISQPS